MDLDKFINFFPTTFYKAKIKIDNENFEILEFKLLKKSNYTSFSQEEFSPQICLSNTEPKDLLNIKTTLYQKLKNKDYENITIEYSFKDKNKKIIRFKDKLSLIDQKDNIYTFYGVGIDITKEYEFAQIVEKMNESNFFGILVYQNENILYLNNKLKEIFKFSSTYNKKLSDIIPIDLIDDKEYTENALMLKNSENEKIFIKFLKYEIIFNNTKSTLLIIIDCTKEEKELLNRQLLNSLYEEAFFKKTDIKKLTKFLNNYYSSVYLCDSNFNVLHKNGKPVKADFNSFIIRTLKSPKTINDLKKYGISKQNSLVIIPIVINNETQNYLLIFSEYKNDFENFTQYAQKIKKIFEFIIKSS